MQNRVDLSQLVEGSTYLISPIDSEEKRFEAILVNIVAEDGSVLLFEDFDGEEWPCSLSQVDELVPSNPVKEMLRGSYYYESTSVRSTKKYKSCDLCGSSIPVGSAHNGAKLFSGEFYQVNFCNTCDTNYSVELGVMCSGGYDNY